MRDVRGHSRRRWARWATVSALLVAQWSQAVEAKAKLPVYEPEPEPMPGGHISSNWMDTSGTYVAPEVTDLEETETRTMGVVTNQRGGEEGDLELDPRMQYEYLVKMATDAVGHTMDQLDHTVGRNEAADAVPDAEQAGERINEGEWITEGAHDASAGGEVQVDEDGNEVDQQMQEEMRGEKEMEMLQQDVLLVRFYRHLTLGLGASLLACMGLLAWVVYNGGLRCKGCNVAIVRLPTAISSAFGMSLDRDALDPESAQRLSEAKQWAKDASKSLAQTAREIVGMR